VCPSRVYPCGADADERNAPEVDAFAQPRTEVITRNEGDCEIVNIGRGGGVVGKLFNRIAEEISSRLSASIIPVMAQSLCLVDPHLVDRYFGCVLSKALGIAIALGELGRRKPARQNCSTEGVLAGATAYRS
jgi:hypothetical protein